jgi:methylated-DNA-[protein]-cysteine S-methyltransferase
MHEYIIFTPFVSLKLTCTDKALITIEFAGKAQATPSTTKGLPRLIGIQIKQYCQSPKKIFDFPICLQGTDFQKKVWNALRKIPAGKVKTYGELAADLNTSPRAIGNACRRNPVPFIIPCHRVVSKTGIGGFAGATEGEYLTIKRKLLHHEGVEI